MELTALGLLVLGVLLAEPVSRALAAARWPARDPVGGLLAWQAVGLAGGLSLLGSGVVFGLAPLGPTLRVATPAFVHALSAGGLPPQLDVLHLLALIAATVVALRLVGVLLAVTFRTLRARARHRDLLDLLGTPWPAAPGARVLDHPVPVAYCLPGLRSRLVLSAGVLDTLDPPGVRAVLAHERTHLRERHDLVVLPFVAWGATAPFVTGMVCAQIAVAALIEMRADDVAASRVAPKELVNALRSMGGAAPAAALSSFTAALEHRLERIEAPPPPLPVAVRVLVRLAAIALIALPTVLLLFG
ncbi:M56 family metallopeptidase [Pseudonocardia sp. GCM10023141]|uniref:M56 family metallopeptidase n=1 Tax=Pseudonocardia sp. GCM10023141 TaxID=3252653 RepID=UPI003609AB17